MKQCKHCLQFKPLDLFNKCSGSQQPRPECKQCKSKYEQYNRSINRDHIVKEKQDWRKNNQDKVKASAERSTPYRKKWINDNKEHVLRKNKEWYKKHPAKVAAKSAKRNAKKLQATPKWLTKDHFKQIEEFYILAKELQWLSDPTDPLEVDHIIPLQGENVCGLHVPWNLQILPGSINRRKGNR